MRIRTSVSGINSTMKEFKKLSSGAKDRADKVTETYARKMANESAKKAPFDTGALRASISSSPRQVKQGSWEYGSDLPYARRQEYEHHSKKGFIRESVWNNRNPYREALRREITDK